MKMTLKALFSESSGKICTLQSALEFVYGTLSSETGTAESFKFSHDEDLEIATKSDLSARGSIHT